MAYIHSLAVTLNDHRTNIKRKEKLKPSVPINLKKLTIHF
jgi:hypothetical protein